MARASTKDGKRVQRFDAFRRYHRRPKITAIASGAPERATDLHLDESVVVLGNEVELSQVLVNLIVNGLDACLSRKDAEPDHRPTITVRVDRQGDDCVLSVGDNGTGISPEDQARIFAPLFTTKPNGVGTGLGLGIVKRVVSSHEGSLELSSNLGEGTTFRLILPSLSSSSSDTTQNEPALPA